MTIRFNPLIAAAVVGTFLLSCSEFKYNHPFDPDGDGEYGTLDISCFGDDDNDGIINHQDPDHSCSDFLKDVIPPVITLIGDDTVYIAENDPHDSVFYYTERYEATDNSGKVFRLTTEHNVNSAQTNMDGPPYTMTYNVMDSAGNKASAVRYVYIVPEQTVDTTPPIISLKGEAEVTISQGSNFFDFGATAYDAPFGPLDSSAIRVEGTVNTAVVGTCTLTYIATDKSGNSSKKTRIVHVIENTGPDVTNPVITLLGPDTIKVPKEVKISDFIDTYQDPGYEASDDRDGNITSKVLRSEILQISPKYWYITYDVADSAGNRAPTMKRIIETTASTLIQLPIIDLNFPDSVIKVVVGGKFIEPGYTASDADDGDLTDQVVVNDSILQANITVPGTYQVSYRVENSAGGVAQKWREVKVVKNEYDITPPEITILGRNPDTVLYQGSASYNDPGATAMDDFDGDITSKIRVSGTVNMKSLGKNTITYTVADSAKHIKTATRVVWVVRDTTTSDLLIAYAVPTEESLPSLPGPFKHFEIDGDGPDLSVVKDGLSINWDASPTQQKVHYMAISLTVAPHNLELHNSTKMTHTFGSAYPTLTLKNTGIEGLDGDYYVAYRDREFIWVDQKGKFAIIWQP